jgi:fimbrial chaperone protein
MRSLRLCLLLCLPASLPLPAWAAAQLAVQPLSLTLPAAQFSTAVTLTNNGDKPVTLQAEVFDWQQINGEDQLSETRSLVASPAVVEVPAGAQQIIRVGRLVTATPASKEQAYRLKISEIPTDKPMGQVSSILQLVLPLFVPPRTSSNTPNKAAIKAEARADGQHLLLQLVNLGNQRGRLTMVKVESGGQSIELPQNAYVLAGSQRTLRLPYSEFAGLPVGDAVLTLTYDRKGGTQTVPLPVRVLAP